MWCVLVEDRHVPKRKDRAGGRSSIAERWIESSFAARQSWERSSACIRGYWHRRDRRAATALCLATGTARHSDVDLLCVCRLPAGRRQRQLPFRGRCTGCGGAVGWERAYGHNHHRAGGSTGVGVTTGSGRVDPRRKTEFTQLDTTSATQRLNHGVLFQEDDQRGGGYCACEVRKEL